MHDLATNIIPLVRNYNYCAIAINSIERLDNDIKFIPFANDFHTGHVLVWRKNSHYSPLVNKFINSFQ